jgi:hypothetical protein
MPLNDPQLQPKILNSSTEVESQSDLPADAGIQTAFKPPLKTHVDAVVRWHDKPATSD